MIVVLVPGFPGNEQETDCLPPVQTFVKAITRRNPDKSIHVVSLQYPFRKRTYSWNGVTVHALAGGNKRFPLRFLCWIQAARIVLQLIRSHRVVVLHSIWLAECTYLASWILWFRRTHAVKHIATIIGQDALANNPYLKHLQFDRMTITATSGHAAEEFQRSTGRQVQHVIPIGLDAAEFHTDVCTLERTIDVLGAGSLIPIKNYRLFLEIVSQLAPEFPGLRCVILGEGPERPLLEDYIGAHNLKHAVQLAGHVPREKVLETMSRSRIFLHTSDYEGQGYVLLEALAAGTRVVCRDVGYTGDSAAVVRCKSTPEMVNALRSLLSDPQEQIDSNVLTIDQTAEAFEKIYGLG